MAQKYTSKNTSINSKKLPRLHRMILDGQFGDIDIFLTVFDYGCGKFTDHIKNAYSDASVRYLGYDKFNKSEKENNDAIDWARLIGISGNSIICTCSNVLNVIDDDETIVNIIEDMLSISPCALITVYEGDKSGIGKETAKDCYQRNLKLKEYEQFAKRANAKVFFEKGGVMVVSRF